MFENLIIMQREHNKIADTQTKSPNRKMFFFNFLFARFEVYFVPGQAFSHLRGNVDVIDLRAVT